MGVTLSSGGSSVPPGRSGMIYTLTQMNCHQPPLGQKFLRHGRETRPPLGTLGHPLLWQEVCPKWTIVEGGLLGNTERNHPGNRDWKGGLRKGGEWVYRDSGVRSDILREDLQSGDT